MAEELAEERPHALGGIDVEVASIEHSPLVGLGADPLDPAAFDGVGQVHQPTSRNRSSSSASSPPAGTRMRLRLEGVRPNSTMSFRISSIAWSAMLRYGLFMGKPFSGLFTMAPNFFTIASASTQRLHAVQ